MREATTDEILAGVRALEGSGGAGVIDRDVVVIDGSDALTYLQGQTSQDLTSLSVGRSAWSFVLAPTGRVDSWVRIHRIADESFLLEVESGWGDALRARLTRFLLRTRATIGEVQRWALVVQRWGADANPAPIAPDGAITATAIGPGVHGVDALLRLGAGAAATHAVADRVPPAAIERHRIVHGIPRLGAELTDATIPGEAGQWVIDASVSFTKGCYTGQELVARIDSRGNNVPHPIRLLVVDGAVGSGSEVVIDDEMVGTVTSVAPALDDRHPTVVLARVGRAVVPGLECRVGSAPARCVEPAAVG
jgi:folate-binding protein YgfZ